MAGKCAAEHVLKNKIIKETQQKIGQGYKSWFGDNQVSWIECSEERINYSWVRYHKSDTILKLYNLKY